MLRYFADIDVDGTILSTIATDVHETADPIMPAGRIEIPAAYWLDVQARAVTVDKGAFVPIQKAPPVPSQLDRIEATLALIKAAVKA